MSARHTAAIAYTMVEDVIAGLAAAGTPPHEMPGLDEALEMVWDTAKALADLERTARSAGEAAGQARQATIDLVVARWAPPARQPARPAQSAMESVQSSGIPETLAPGVAGCEKFDLARHAVALVALPAGDRARETA